MSHVHDDPANGRFLVDRRAFADPSVAAAEHLRIFQSTWLFVGHESEVPTSGDFLLRDVAGFSLLLTRARDGALHALRNACRHRGAPVCVEPRGHASLFRCAYHGWTYDLTGALTRLPSASGWPASLDRTALSLEPFRVASYRGLVFASCDPAVPGLENWLGDARDVLDATLDCGEDGTEVVGSPQEYVMHTDWKHVALNGVDLLHAGHAHVRYLRWLTHQGVEAQAAANLEATGRDLGNGHGAVEYDGPWGRVTARWIRGMGEPVRGEIEQSRARLVERLGPERGDRVALSSRNLLLFPNLLVNDLAAPTLRTFWPDGPGRTRIRAFALAPRGESAALRRVRLDYFLAFFGPGGFSSPDDAALLEPSQRRCEEPRPGSSDYSRGLGGAPSADDEAMRAFWREWARRVEVP